MKRLAIFLLLYSWTWTVWAQDFSLVVSSGQTLYFSIVAGGVEVTYPNHTSMPVNGWDDYTRPTGALQIPASVNYNGEVLNVLQVGQLAFYECTGLSSVAIGGGVTWLGNSAFNGCSGLQTVVIPASMDTVGLRVFEGCTALSDVWCNRPTPPRTSPYSFYNLSLASSTLHVPAGSQAAYSAAAPWSDFGNVVADGPMVTLSLAANDPLRGSVAGGGTYSVGTVLNITAVPSAGYTFICWNDGDERNPRPLTLTDDKMLWAMFFPRLSDTVSVPMASLSVRTSDEALGVGVGTVEVPVGTLVEVCALPLAGSFAGWSDASHENPRRVAVTEDMVLTAFFEQLSTPSVDLPQWHVQARGRGVVVSGAKHMEISVYDNSGRLVATALSTSGEVLIPLPAAGVYIVWVGETGAKKVTVE